MDEKHREVLKLGASYLHIAAAQAVVFGQVTKAVARAAVEIYRSDPATAKEQSLKDELKILTHGLTGCCLKDAEWGYEDVEKILAWADIDTSGEGNASVIVARLGVGGIGGYGLLKEIACNDGHGCACAATATRHKTLPGLMSGLDSDEIEPLLLAEL